MLSAPGMQCLHCIGCIFKLWVFWVSFDPVRFPYMLGVEVHWSCRVVVWVDGEVSNFPQSKYEQVSFYIKRVK